MNLSDFFLKTMLSSAVLLPTTLFAGVILTEGEREVIEISDIQSVDFDTSEEALYKVLAGGDLLVESGGIIKDAQVEQNGILTISGRAIDTILDRGAKLILDRGTMQGNSSIDRGSTLESYGGTHKGYLHFSQGIFAPALDAENPNAHTLVVNGGVYISESTIAPFWVSGARISHAQTVSFTVIEAENGFGDQSWFYTEKNLLNSIYAQRIEDGILYLDVTGKAPNIVGLIKGIATENTIQIGDVLNVILEGSGANKDFAIAFNNLGENPLLVAQAATSLTNEAVSNVTSSSIASVKAITGVFPTFSSSTKMSSLTPLQYYAQSSVGIGTDARVHSYSDDSLYFFGTPFGSTIRQKNSKEFKGYKLNSVGVSLGVVKTTDDTLYGIGVGYNNQSLKMNDSTSKTTSNQLSLSIFGSKELLNNIVLDAAIGYAHSWNNSKRDVLIGDYYTNHGATYGSDFYFANIKGSYILELEDELKLIPSIGLDYVHVKAKGFSEDGGDSALKISSSKYNAIELPISLKVQKQMKIDGGFMTPSFELSYIRNLGKKHSSTTSSFVAIPEAGSFVTQSSPIHRNRGKVATGVEFNTNKNIQLGLNYSYGFASKYSGHSILADIRYRF